jgi:hypothetical protein
MAWQANVPYVTVFRYRRVLNSGEHLLTLNGITVWTASSPSPGFLLIDAPTLGVSVTGTGLAAAQVIETLRYSSNE